jgi:nucleotide-binding universal stress UspA family protein
MYRILVAMDGSEEANRAAQFAVDLAQRISESEILVLNVQDPVEESQTHGLAHDAIIKHREQLAQGTAAQALAVIEKAGIRCQFDWSFGDPAHTIAEQARIRNCNLIVMGTHGTGRLANVLLGSVAQSTVHLSMVPVALVR